MTREDAIKWLKTFRGRYGMNELEDAVDMAIKALKQESCEDCISRKVATDRFDLVQSDDKCMGYDDIMAFLSSLPSVEPERKTGHWIPRNSFLVPYKCSECNYESERYDNFCPNCGAKMVEPQESEDNE